MLDMLEGTTSRLDQNLILILDCLLRSSQDVIPAVSLANNKFLCCSPGELTMPFAYVFLTETLTSTSSPALRWTSSRDVERISHRTWVELHDSRSNKTTSRGKPIP